MSISKSPSGTRGARTPPRFLGRVLMPIMMRLHRRKGDRFNGMDLLYLSTVGARSGQPRTNPMARFEDGAGGWYVVASAGGAATHPAWYHNVVAHPGQVWAEVGGHKQHVRVAQLEGEEREKVWAQVVARAPAFEDYLSKTDRQLPVLRLTPQ